ncbi:MAG: ExbD/TolR family protein [Deltaproteobacteria bacterium]
MRFLRKKPEEETILLTPFVDIVLNLLIFFAVTSQFDIASGVRIKLPQVSRIIAGQEENKATVVIDSSGQAYFEGKPIDMKDLEQRLKSLVQEKGNLQLVLQADEAVRHGTVVEAMDLAKSVGVQSIVIAAQWKAKKSP